MNPSTMRKLTAVAVALGTLAIAQSALGCEVTRTPWGLRMSNCALKDLYNGRFDLPLEADPTPPRLWLPNLLVTDVDSSVISQAVDVSVEVLNNGRRDAGVFEVAVVASVTDPLNNGRGVGVYPLGPVQVSSLAVGASAGKYAGRVFLPNRAQDWDVCNVAIADPPGGTRWVGSVLESNESDNQWPTLAGGGCCRVYGPKPDVSGPPACQ